MSQDNNERVAPGGANDPEGSRYCRLHDRMCDDCDEDSPDCSHDECHTAWNNATENANADCRVDALVRCLESFEETCGPDLKAGKITPEDALNVLKVMRVFVVDVLKGYREGTA